MSNTVSLFDEEDLVIAAIGVSLMHDPQLLSIKDLGNLSICSKGTQKAVETASIWKGVFEYAAALELDDDAPRKCSWNGERGFLSCFANPDPKIIQRVGYKNAAGCLMSKTCKHCHKFAGTANPFMMERVCADLECKAKSIRTIVKSKAKDSFLLNEKDISDLPKVVLDSGIGPGGLPSTFYSLDDVVNIAYAKWGGSDALADEITSRKAKAMQRYQNSQRTTKPQKRLPKICGQANRPADSPGEIVCRYADEINIGVVSKTPDDAFSRRKTSKFYFDQCVRCPMGSCGFRGLIRDMEDHLLVDHHAVLACRADDTERKALGLDSFLCTPPTDLLDMGNLRDFCPAELVTILSAASSKISYKPRSDDEMECDACSSAVKSYCVDFGGVVKIIIKEEEFPYGRVTGFCQINGPITHETLFLVDHEAKKWKDASFIKESILQQVFDKLGLTQTTATQFVAGIFAKVYGKSAIRATDIGDATGCGYDSNYCCADCQALCHFGVDFGPVPILRDAFHYLQSEASEEE